MASPAAQPELRQCDAARACLRWIYAARRLALPLTPQHVEYIRAVLGKRPDEVPDELVDQAVIEHGCSAYLADRDCGSPGILPATRFDGLRSEFCKHEIESRRTGVWPQAATRAQSDFDRTYHARVQARRDGRDPGIFHAFTRGPHQYRSSADEPPADDECPF